MKQAIDENIWSTKNFSQVREKMEKILPDEMRDNKWFVTDIDVKLQHIYPHDAGINQRVAYDIEDFLSQIPVDVFPQREVAGKMRIHMLHFASYGYDKSRLSKYDKIKSDYGILGGPSGHHTCMDVEFGLKLGISGLRKEVISRLKGDMPGKNADFLKSLLICCDAFSMFANRHADTAAEMAADAESDEDRERLGRVSVTCRKIALNPPETFQEAVQFLNLFAIIEQMVSAGPGHGRIDQYLYPYYKSDIESGGITRDQAKIILRDLINNTFTFYGIGGIDADGNDATNDLSFLFLEALDESFGTTYAAVRYHKNINPKLMEYACDIIVRRRLGTPVFLNDEAIIPAYINQGFGKDEAWDYSFCGCVGLAIPGKEYPRHDEGHIILPTCLERALRSGREKGFTTYNEFFIEFKKNVTESVGIFKEIADSYDVQKPYVYPEVMSSLFSPDCLESARDMSDNGVKYSVSSIYAQGLANAADSFAAMKKLIFEDRKITLDQLYATIDKDFEGCEELRQNLLSAPKFGNDDDYVDSIALEIINHFYGEVVKGVNCKGHGYRPGIYSNIGNVNVGYSVGALPDGRKAGTPIAHSANPMHGRSRSITSAIKSVTKIDFTGATAAPVNLSIHPTAVSGENGAKILKSVIETFFSLGGNYFMCNIVDTDMLKDAMKNPENYRDLLVRVGGYNDYFTLQSPDIQMEIISRGEMV